MHLESQSQSFKGIPINLYTVFHPHLPFLEAVTVLQRGDTLSSDLTALARSLNPGKMAFQKGHFEFWEEPEITGGEVGCIGWMPNQMDAIVIKTGLC